MLVGSRAFQRRQWIEHKPTLGCR